MKSRRQYHHLAGQHIMVPRDQQLCQFDPRAKWQTENSELEILPLSLGSTFVLVYELLPVKSVVLPGKS